MKKKKDSIIELKRKIALLQGVIDEYEGNTIAKERMLDEFKSFLTRIPDTNIPQCKIIHLPKKFVQEGIEKICSYHLPKKSKEVKLLIKKSRELRKKTLRNAHRRKGV